MFSQKSQRWPKSCGAAASLVARVELGDAIALTDTNEDLIYNQAEDPGRTAGGF